LNLASSTYRPNYQVRSECDGRSRAPRSRGNDDRFKDSVYDVEDRHHREPRSCIPPTLRTATYGYRHRSRPRENEYRNNEYPSQSDERVAQPQAVYASV
jgi:hypothetical protein